MHYEQQALASATRMDLVIALYDGSIRFLYRALRAVEEDDVIERRFAVKRALDIFMYLQARLRMDIGGKPAEALADFYSAMFQATLEASHAASAERFKEVIACVKNVRDAWVVASRDPEVAAMMPHEYNPPPIDSAARLPAPAEGTSVTTAWRA